MIKQITGVFILFLVLQNISLFAQSNKFRISGNVEDKTATSIYFNRTNFFDNTVDTSVTIDIVNGQFSYEGSIEEPSPAFLSFKSSPQSQEEVFQFILDSGVMEVQFEKDLSRSSLKGSKSQDAINQYISGQSPIMLKVQAMNETITQQMQEGINQDSVLSLYRKPYQELQNELYNYQRDFLKQNNDVFITLLIIPELAGSTSDYLEADSIFQMLNEEIRESKSGKYLEEYIQNEMKTSIGAIAPDFFLPDSSGTNVALSSLRGKYVLLDFWAAWCAPCRQENPNVVLAYNRYQDNGFTVFGVSLDRDRDVWLKAIATDKLNWQHVSDLKFWASEPAVQYGITSIPRNFLLDPEGRIIRRDLRGEELQDYLAELFESGTKD